jgi:hypothetical protein
MGRRERCHPDKMSVLNYFPKLLRWGGNTIVIIGQDLAIQFSFKDSNGVIKGAFTLGVRDSKVESPNIILPIKLALKPSYHENFNVKLTFT